MRLLVCWIVSLAVVLSPARAQVVSEDGMVPVISIPNHRQLLRDIILEMSDYAKERNPDFQIVTYEGMGLTRWGEWEATLDGLKMEAGAPQISPGSFAGDLRRHYVLSIDGILLDGHQCEGKRFSANDLNSLREVGLHFMSTEACSSEAEAMQAIQSLWQEGIPAHAHTDRSGQHRSIPVRRPFEESEQNAGPIHDIHNLMIFTESAAFADKHGWMGAVEDSNYDLVVVDAFGRGGEALTGDEVHALKHKRLGATRLVFAYMDLTRAHDDRYYWNREWRVGSPGWILEAESGQPGMYRVAFWHPRWKAIIGSYLAGIMDLGFDGVVFGGADAHYWFEERFNIN